MSFFDDVSGGRDLLRRSLLRLRRLFLPSTGGLHIGDNTLDAEADSGGNIDPFWKRADGTSANLSDPVSLGAAPNSVNYLVGTASADLSAEIAVGTTPGGQLGNTWANPTVDSSHSGSAHHAESHSLASHSSEAHSELTSVTTSQHHIRPLGDVARCSSNLTLTTSVVDITGATLTLANAGKYIITGVFHFQGVSDDGETLEGVLIAGGSEQTGRAFLSTNSDNPASTETQIWEYSASASDVVKLAAKKSGGAGTSRVNATSTAISAIGPLD